MLEGSAHKVQSRHLSRRACLYIRQSSPHQVTHNTESTRRQYDLRHRARALGWPDDCINIIDEDQGKSGAHMAHRTGFRDLLVRVAANEVGIVLSLEVSRLRRNNADWHQLLQFAALTDILILDEAGVYDPKGSNDRLLLGLKGAISEYELQGIKDGLDGGRRNKAMRGERIMPLPIGFVYTDTKKVVLDPDQSVTDSIHLVFHTFRRLGSISQTLRCFQKQELRLPSRHPYPRGLLHWSLPGRDQLRRVLRSPRYAGCYAYGRRSIHQRVDGSRKVSNLPMKQWLACIPEAHVGYIDWQEYLRDQETIDKNAASCPLLKAPQTPPREGPALLQSRILCGHCGTRMRVSYSKYKGRTLWYYKCNHEIVRHCTQPCPSTRGETIDAAVSHFLVAAVNRQNIALTLAVREQLRADFATADHQHAQRIEALHYQTNLARNRYMQVDPDNRLVAASLEADWNAAMLALEEAEKERQKLQVHYEDVTDSSKDAHILALASDFKTVWDAPATTHEERKHLLGLLIEDITVTRDSNQVRADLRLRLRGGKVHTLPSVALPKRRAGMRRRDISQEARAELNVLLETGFSDRLAAEELNRRGYLDSEGQPFFRSRITMIRNRLGIPSCLYNERAKLREIGYLTAAELAATLQILPQQVYKRADKGQGIECYRIAYGKRCYKMFKFVPEDEHKPPKHVPIP